jgi:hypothetical protein
MVSQSGTCQEFTDFGSWCVFDEGDQCYVGSNNPPFGCGQGAASSSMGCDIADGCSSGMVACTPSANFAPTCQGDRLVLDCSPWGQPTSINCAAPEVGGTTCQDAQCIGVTDGSECTVGLTACADGLECRDIDGVTGVGVCGESTVAPPTDAGPGSTPDAGGGNGGSDAGSTPPADGGGGGGDSGGGDDNGGGNGGGGGGEDDAACSSHQVPSTRFPAALALVGLLGWRLSSRRRRR